MEQRSILFAVTQHVLLGVQALAAPRKLLAILRDRLRPSDFITEQIYRADWLPRTSNSAGCLVVLGRRGTKMQTPPLATSARPCTLAHRL